MYGKLINGIYTPYHVYSYMEKYRKIGKNLFVNLGQGSKLKDLLEDPRTVRQVLAETGGHPTVGDFLKSLLRKEKLVRATAEDTAEYEKKKARHVKFIEDVKLREKKRQEKAIEQEIERAKKVLKKYGVSTAECYSFKQTHE